MKTEDIILDVFAEDLCTEPPRTQSIFGINDGEPDAPSPELRRAYTTSEGNDWNAIVDNAVGKTLQFIPLDHNVTLGEILLDGLSDGLLYTTEDSSYIAFIELKSKGKRWIQEGIEQLEKTITRYQNGSNPKQFAHRCAYLCNNRHPHFHYSHKQEMQRFRDKTSFRLHIAQKIQVS